MAYTTIKKPSDYFNPVAYAGDGTSGRGVTSGFATDFVWIKNRNTTDDHVIFDKVRGGTKYIYTNATQAESTYSSLDLTFENTGVNVGSYTTINNNGSNLISYHWKANGTGVSNTQGDIASTVSVNTTSGFSIVSYTGTGSVATVGHGLGVAPKVIIIKERTGASNWKVYHSSVITASASNKSYLYLNTSDAILTNGGDTSFTEVSNSVFGVGTDSELNQSGIDHIAYCFAEKQGFSKFGSYVGNGSTDGTFVYTGFKPAFVIIKRTDALSTRDWFILDNKRDTENPVTQNLYANVSNAEVASERCDFLSNGFKLTTSSGGSNASNGTFIYMAIAEEPLVGDNPATAR